MRIIHPDDSARIAREVERYLRQGIDRFEQSYRLSLRMMDTPGIVTSRAGDTGRPRWIVSLRGYLGGSDQIKAMQLAVEEEAAPQELRDRGAPTSAPGRWNVQTGGPARAVGWVVGYRLNQLVPVSIDTWTRLAHPDDLERSGGFAGTSPAKTRCYGCRYACAIVTVTGCGCSSRPRVRMGRGWQTPVDGRDAPGHH